jgi:hypothetical protein
VSLSEATFALSENRIKWKDWAQRAPLFQEIIDEEVPVLHWDSVLHVNAGRKVRQVAA